MNIGDTVYAWKFYMWLCLLHEEGIYMSLCLYDTLFVYEGGKYMLRDDKILKLWSYRLCPT
jgi:hypothetical protein